MKAVAVIALALLAVAFVSAADVEKDEGIYVLTDKNYDTGVAGFEYVLVQWYAPWCGHCKALGPEFVKAAQVLREKDSEIKLAKIDGTTEEETLKKLEIKGYPTLMFYRNGVPIKYGGGRMAAEIVAWVEKKIGPAAPVLEDAAAAKEFIADNDVAVIGFFKDAESDAAKKFLDAVRDYEGYPVAITSSEEVATAHEAKDETVVLFKKFDEGRATYEGAIGEERLLEFIERYALPVVIEFNHETAQKIFKGLVKSHILFFISKTSEEYEEKYKVIHGLAPQFKAEVMFVIVDTDEDDHRRVIEFLGLKSEPLPTMRIIQMKEDIIKYKPDSTKLEEGNIKAFVEKYIAGDVPIHYLTETLPEDWNSKPVKYLTGTNFDEVVMDKSKNSLVEFYAPWCGHCKQLAPIWEQLAEAMESKDDVVVAMMDATLNELPGERVRSFPTIKLFKKDTNEAVEYNGARTLEGIQKFLETDGVFGMAAPDDTPHDEL